MENLTSQDTDVEYNNSQLYFTKPPNCIQGYSETLSSTPITSVVIWKINIFKWDNYNDKITKDR